MYGKVNIVKMSPYDMQTPQQRITINNLKVCKRLQINPNSQNNLEQGAGGLITRPRNVQGSCHQRTLKTERTVFQ